MDDRLVAALERDPRISAWTARRSVARGGQVYLAGHTVESLRSVGREVYSVEVFREHEHEGEPSLGSATVPIGADELDRLPQILDEALGMAALVHNPPWSLPDPVEHPDVPLADPAITGADPVALARQTATEIVDLVAATGAGVRLSAAELFLTVVDEELQNSRGLTAAGTSTRVLFELTLLADGPQEAEFFHQAETRRLGDLGIDELVATNTAYAREATRAEVVTTRRGPVVIRDSALEQLLGGGVVTNLGAYLAQTAASSAYDHLTRFEVGESVYLGHEPHGDLLSFRSNARRPYAPLSYRFDDDGLPALDLPVVEDGVLLRRTATQRYAQYLGLPPTGRAGVLEIRPGSHSLESLLSDGPLLEVVAFSSANVDRVSGDFGMEIRLGHLVGPDGSTPVRGGSITGNLFEAMADVRFSAETTDLPGFSGPRAIRFESLQVAGDDPGS